MLTVIQDLIKVESCFLCAIIFSLLFLPAGQRERWLGLILRVLQGDEISKSHRMK